MTEATRTTAYLKQALALDPYTRAARIVALREKFHRRAPRAKAGRIQDGESFRERHLAAQTYIHRARTEFWKLPDEALKSLLDSVDLRSFPHLAATVGRLKVVASNRNAIRTHPRQSDPERSLVKLVRTVLVGEPHEAAHARKDLEDKARWKSPRKRIAAWLDQLRNEAPAVFTLEAEWFENLKRGHRSAVTRVDRIVRQTAPVGDSTAVDVRKSGYRVGWFVILLVAVNVVRVLVTHAPKESPTTAPPVVVRPAAPIPMAPPLRVQTVPQAPAGDRVVPARPDVRTRNEAMDKAMKRLREITEKRMKELGADVPNAMPPPGRSLGVPPIPPVPRPGRSGPPPGPP